MKKFFLMLLLVPGLAMAAVNVKFSVTFKKEKVKGVCLVHDGEPMNYVCDNGLEILGNVTVDGPHVSFDLQLQKDGEIICSPCLDTFLSSKAKMKVQDYDKNTLFKFSIMAAEIEEDVEQDVEENEAQEA